MGTAILESLEGTVNHKSQADCEREEQDNLEADYADAVAAALSLIVRKRNNKREHDYADDIAALSIVLPTLVRRYPSSLSV